MGLVTAEVAARLPVYTGATEGPAVVLMPLSAYELANLAEMFRALAPAYFKANWCEGGPVLPTPRVGGVFNSGDWFGVLAARPDEMQRTYALDMPPNVSAAEYQRRLGA